MKQPQTHDGVAIVYCEGAYRTPNGKTAHGLVRFTRRYAVVAVIDSTCSGDAGALLDGRERSIPVVPHLAAALDAAEHKGLAPTHFVIGLAPDGGRLSDDARSAVVGALEVKLHVDSGLHDFVSDDRAISAIAAAQGLRIRDVRRPPDRAQLHPFTGRIDEVGSFRIALLGTDSAVGKRTTAWMIVEALQARGLSAEMIGTGQTAWMQGVGFGIILDSIVNDFVAGELEHAVVTAWEHARPDFMVIEGQGGLMNPAYPGGFEILAATRPGAIVLQHAPARREYDGFPGFVLDSLGLQIRALEVVSRGRVDALTLNTAGIAPKDVSSIVQQTEAETERITVAPLEQGVDRIVDHLLKLRDGHG